MNIAAVLDSIPSAKEGMLKDAMRKGRQGKQDYQYFFGYLYLYILDQIADAEGYGHVTESIEHLKKNYCDIYIDMSAKNLHGEEDEYYWMMKIDFDVDFLISEDKLREYFFDNEFDQERCGHSYDCCGSYYYNAVDINLNNYWEHQYQDADGNHKTKFNYTLIATRKALKNI